MKKIILTIAVAALAATSAFAQFSVGAGYARTSSTAKSGSTTSKEDPLNGFYAGFDYGVNIAGSFKVTPGVYFSMFTGQTDYSVGSLANTKATRTEMYLNIPVNFSYSFPLGSSVSAFVFAGPTANVGLSDKLKIDVNTVVGGGSSSYDVYKENSDYKRFDIMIGGGAGIDIVNKVRVSVGYNYGLLDRDGSSNSTLHRSELHAGVAYLF